MKTTVNFTEFCDRFAAMDRNDNFTYDGKKALFDYLEELEQDTGEEMELDVIAICCDYSEYESAAAAVAEYDPDYEYILTDAQTCEEEAISWLSERTQVIELPDGGVIIQQF